MSETIGLDIGSHSIKMVGLKKTSKGPFLTFMGIKEIPPEANREDGSYISEILKLFLLEVGVKPKKVHLVVSGSGIHVRRITLPYMPKGELREAIRWEIKAHLPFPIESARVDFHILDEFIEDDVKKLDLIVVACPENLIEQTLSIAEGAGLKITHLDVAPFALWNVLISSNLLKTDETIALLDLGTEKTGIHIFKDGALQFSREITPAGSDVTRTIMEEILSKGSVQIRYEEAERIKKEIGIPSETQLKEKTEGAISLSKISFLLRPLLEKMAGEIRLSMDYFRNQFNAERIDRVLLTGGGARLKNLSSYLSNELNCSVQLFNPLKGIIFDSEKIDPQVLEDEGPSLTIAFGIAIPEPNRIELLPVKEPLLSRIQIGKLIPIIAPLITLLIFLWIAWDMHGKFLALQKELDLKKAKVANIEALKSRLTLLKDKEGKLKQELSLYPSSITVPVPYRTILREIHQILPENMTLTSLEVHRKGKPIKKEPKAPGTQTQESQTEDKEIYFSGLVFGTDLNCLNALAQFIERLENSSLFKNVRLISANETKSYNQPSVEFEILSDIVLSGEKPTKGSSL
ncbi:MAG: type IV pilus assembly protein PilM [Thermodesulfobacteriota bacterium]